MNANGGAIGWLSRFRHPRLVVLAVVGALVGLAGSILVLADPAPGTEVLGLRLAVLGYLVFLLGASGYLAFAVFDRGLD